MKVYLILPLILLSLMIILNNNGLAINNKSFVWMPVKYLDEIKKKNSDKGVLISLTIPIESIVYEDNKLFIVTNLYTDFEEYNYDIVNKNPLTLKIKGQLYFPGRDKKESNISKRFKNADIYLRFVNNYLEVIIENNNKVDSIIFTKYLYDNKIIRNKFFDLFSLFLSGKYDVYDSLNMKLETDIMISPNNSFLNSNILKSYSLDFSEPYLIKREDGYYSEAIIEVIKQNGEIIQLLAFIGNNNDIIFCNYIKLQKYDYVKKDVIFIIKYKEPYNFNN